MEIFTSTETMVEWIGFLMQLRLNSPFEVNISKSCIAEENKNRALI